MEKMEQLMMKVWGLQKPNLLISVTGGANFFNMKTKLKQAFRFGLMKAARSTGRKKQNIAISFFPDWEFQN